MLILKMIHYPLFQLITLQGVKCMNTNEDKEKSTQSVKPLNETDVLNTTEIRDYINKIEAEKKLPWYKRIFSRKKTKK